MRLAYAGLRTPEQTGGSQKTLCCFSHVTLVIFSLQVLIKTLFPDESLYYYSMKWDIHILIKHIKIKRNI